MPYRYEIDRYIDPRDIDWSDSLDPRTHSVTGQFQSEANFADFERSTMLALRNAGAYDPSVRVVPNGADINVAANASFEDLFSVPPGSFLIALSGNDSNGQGFKFQIRDLGTGHTLYTSPHSSRFVYSRNQGPYYLQKPWCLATGQLAVQIINQANAPNKIQLLLWLASVSLDHDRIPNQYDAQLANEARLALGAPLALSGVEDTANIDSYRVMPKEGKPFLLLKTAPAPAAGATSTIASFRVPPQTRAAITQMRHYYNGVGFLDGGPELAWQITVDGVVIAPGFESLNTQIGVQGFQALAGPLTAKPGQLVEYRVTAAADLGGSVTCGLQGFYYPA